MSRERIVTAFPYVLAAVLPLAGVLLVVLRLVEGSRDVALRLAFATLAGLFLYAAIFTA